MRYGLPSRLARSAFFVFAVLVALLGPASGADDSTPVGSSDGKYTDKSGNPTFQIAKDGTVDWYTYIGYQQYGANCLQCHGPDALGSSYAPSLVDAMKSLDYKAFFAIVEGGKRAVGASQDLVMPALGTNKNVMCNIDAIYVYLRARADGALGRGRPDKHVDKPANFDKVEASCLD